MVKGTVLHGYGKLKPIPVPEQTRDTLSWVYPYPCHALGVIQSMIEEKPSRSVDQTLGKPPKSNKPDVHLSIMLRCSH